jgi:hypothetical protein
MWIGKGPEGGIRALAIDPQNTATGSAGIHVEVFKLMSCCANTAFLFSGVGILLTRAHLII